MNSKATKNERIKKESWNKKAVSAYFQLIFIFFRMFVLIFVMFSIIFIVHYFIERHIDVIDGELNVFADYLYYSKQGVSYYDPVAKRLYPGIVDYEELKNKEEIEKKFDMAFNYGNYPLMSANISLFFNDHVKNEENVMDIDEMLYNGEWYKRWHSLLGWTFGRGQSAKKAAVEYPVLVRVSRLGKIELVPAIMRFQIITPVS